VLGLRRHASPVKALCNIYKGLNAIDKIIEEVTAGGREATPVLTGSVKVKI